MIGNDGNSASHCPSPPKCRRPRQAEGSLEYVETRSLNEVFYSCADEPSRTVER
jgi:hypothetical protein